MRDDDIDPVLLRRRKQKQQARRRLILFGAGGAVLLVVCVVVAVAATLRNRDRGGAVAGAGMAAPGLFGPSASSEGEKWNHADLHAHLTRAGLKLDMKPVHAGGILGGPTVYFYGPQTKAESNDQGPYIDDAFKLQGFSDIVLVQLHETPRKASDEAGIHGARGWSWGRFAFRVNANGGPLLEQVKAALR